MQNLFRNLFAILAIQFALTSTAYSQSGLRDKDIQFSENWLDEVRVSVSDDKLLAAAMVARFHDELLASELLVRALESLDHDPILLSTAIQSCFSGAPITLCQGDSLFDELIQVDRDNLEPYLYFMLRLVKNGNPDRSLAILNEGMKRGTHHNIYSVDKTRFLAQQLVSVGYPSEEVNFPAEFYANSSANYSFFLEILSTCKTLSVSSENWKLSCLFLGARLQNNSKGLMPKVFGGAIQRDVLIAVDADEDVIQLVIEHNEWINKIRDTANEKVRGGQPDLSLFDSPDSFINDMTETTEFEAILRSIYRTQ